MKYFTVWPDKQRSSDYGEIKAIDAEDAARLFYTEYYADSLFEEMNVWVQQRNDDQAKLFHVRAVPEIEFYAEEV